jgi:hypothetical protein
MERNMLKRSLITIALFGATISLAHAEDAGRKDPKTGKNCVTQLSSETTDTGLLRMYFRNTCDSKFQVQIMASTRTRAGSIDPGTPEKPSKGYVTCKTDDQCEVAKWKYD